MAFTTASMGCRPQRLNQRRADEDRHPGRRTGTGEMQQPSSALNQCIPAIPVESTSNGAPAKPLTTRNSRMNRARQARTPLCSTPSDRILREPDQQPLITSSSPPFDSPERNDTPPAALRPQADHQEDNLHCMALRTVSPDTGRPGAMISTFFGARKQHNTSTLVIHLAKPNFSTTVFRKAASFAKKLLSQRSLLQCCRFTCA